MPTLTPLGLRSPAGCHRVSEAADVLHVANAECAIILHSLFKDDRNLAMARRRWGDDCVTEIEKVLDDQHKAHQELSLAMCGRPRQP